MNNSLPSMSLAISIAVIICMAITFAILIMLYCFAKSRGVKGGVEDETLKTRLISDREKFANSHTEYSGIGYVEYLDKKNKFSRPLRILTDVIFLLLVIAIFSLTVTVLVFRGNGEQLFFGNTTYLTVATGSMSEKNPSNPYIEFLPDNQIAQYSLIGIEKTAEEDLKLYDVVAFSSNGKVYVHRVVGISSQNGEKRFTTMGDANASPMVEEEDLTYSQILGKYNGKKSFGLGSLFIYLKSDVGIIALVFAMLFVLVADVSEGIIDGKYKSRLRRVAEILDGTDGAEPQKAEVSSVEPSKPEEPEEEPEEPKSDINRQNSADGEGAAEKPEEPSARTEVPIILSVREEETEKSAVAAPEEPAEEEKAPEVISEEPDEKPKKIIVVAKDEDEEEEIEETADGYNVVRYDKSFTARIIQSDDKVKEWYGVLKNELLSYKKVRSNMGWKHESFQLGRNRAARIAVRGKTLALYLPLDPEKYAETKYKVEDVSDVASLGELKCLYRIKNDRRAKYAVDLIADGMAKLSAERGEQSSEDWYLPYNGNAVLIERNLIKRKIVKVTENGFWADRNKDKDTQTENSEIITAQNPKEEPTDE